MRAERSEAESDFSAWAVQARPRLLRTATVLTAGDHHLAEDLVQTTLARTFAAWARVRIDESKGEHPNHYAQRVLTRVFIDETRRPWWRRERGTRPLTELDGPVAVPPLSDPAVVHAVQQALAALAPQQRAAVVLRYWAGYDVDEVARQLGCPPATVRTWSSRGLARLRVLLRDDELETFGGRP
jgi:RNA polymerase sigma-70 factor (sigma-E family)